MDEKAIDLAPTSSKFNTSATLKIRRQTDENIDEKLTIEDLATKLARVSVRRLAWTLMCSLYKNEQGGINLSLENQLKHAGHAVKIEDMWKGLLPKNEDSLAPSPPPPARPSIFNVVSDSVSSLAQAMERSPEELGNTLCQVLQRPKKRAKPEILTLARSKLPQGVGGAMEPLSETPHTPTSTRSMSITSLNNERRTSFKTILLPDQVENFNVELNSEETREAKALLRKLSVVLRRMSPKAMSRLVSELQLHSYQQGAVVVAEGHSMESIEIILEGRAQLEVRAVGGAGGGGRRLLRPGQVLGEKELLAATPAMPGTIHAATDLLTCVITAASYWRALVTLMAAEALEQVEELSMLPQAIKDKLTSALSYTNFHQGALILNQSAIASQHYFVLTGEAKLLDKKFRQSQTRWLKLGVHSHGMKLGPGAWFSDGLLDLKGAKAGTIVAVHATEVLSIDVEAHSRVVSFFKRALQHAVASSGVAALGPQTVRATLGTAPELRNPTDVALLTQALKSLKFFATKVDKVRGELCAVLDYTVAGHGQVIFEQGDRGETFYIVLSGEVQVLVTGDDKKQREVGRCGAGAEFGELALLKHAPRAATVVASGVTELAVLSRHHYSTILKREHARRLDQFAKFLGKVATFSAIPRSHLHRLYYYFKVQTFSKGEMVVREGEAGDVLYIIKEGECLMTHQTSVNQDQSNNQDPHHKHPATTRGPGGRVESGRGRVGPGGNKGEPKKKKVTIALLEPKQVFGDFNVFSPKKHKHEPVATQPCSVEARSTVCVVMYIAKDDLAGRLGDDFMKSQVGPTQERYERYLHRAAQGASALLHLPERPPTPRHNHHPHPAAAAVRSKPSDPRSNDSEEDEDDDYDLELLKNLELGPPPSDVPSQQCLSKLNDRDFYMNKESSYFANSASEGYVVLMRNFTKDSSQESAPPRTLPAPQGGGGGGGGVSHRQLAPLLDNRLGVASTAAATTSNNAVASSFPPPGPASLSSHQRNLPTMSHPTNLPSDPPPWQQAPYGVAPAGEGPRGRPQWHGRGMELEPALSLWQMTQQQQLQQLKHQAARKPSLVPRLVSGRLRSKELSSEAETGTSSASYLLSQSAPDFRPDNHLVCREVLPRPGAAYRLISDFRLGAIPRETEKERNTFDEEDGRNLRPVRDSRLQSQRIQRRNSHVRRPTEGRHVTTSKVCTNVFARPRGEDPSRQIKLTIPSH